MQSLLKTAPNARLERETDGEPDSRIAPVVQVIAPINIDDVDFVVVVPVGAPVLRIRIKDRHPVTAVLEAGISADYQERQSLNPEAMVWSEIAAEPGVGDAIAVIASALLPGPVVVLPVAGPVLLPCGLPELLRLLRPLLGDGTLILPLVRPLLGDGTLVLPLVRPLLRDGTLVLLLVRPLLRDGTLVLPLVRPLLRDGTLVLLWVRRPLLPRWRPPSLSRWLLLMSLLLGPGLLVGGLLLRVLLSRLILSCKSRKDESKRQSQKSCGGNV